jgi:hypothetical protein
MKTSGSRRNKVSNKIDLILRTLYPQVIAGYLKKAEQKLKKI